MNKPLILDYATTRSGQDTTPFTYSFEKDMCVIQQNKKEILFIDAKTPKSELLTKTFSDREGDDEHFAFPELITKTDAIRETDDEGSFAFANLLTITKVARESDDYE